MRHALLSLLRAVRTVGSGIAALLARLFGRWHWEAPAWFTRTSALGARSWRYLAANPARAAILAVVLISTVGAYVWYASRPKPHYVTFTISGPELTTYNEHGIASIKPITVAFSESAAPLKQVKTALTAGIDLSPAIGGTWF